jgi:acetaldehyde dehydrogenase/alcohol dehydrogenase
MLWHKLPKSIYFRRGSIVEAMKDLAGKRRALLVTDRFLFQNGLADEPIRLLKQAGIEVEIFADVEADPTLTAVRKGADRAVAFKPDVIVAFGGGSPMDAAKIIWVMYEHPEVHFEDLALRFMDIRKRIYKFPKMGVKAELVAIPTTSGTGSEVTPFAVVTDDAKGMKYPLADYELTPTMAVIDANFVLNLPKSLTAFGGIDAVTHALEAYVSVMANEFSDGQALQALKLLKEYLPAAYTEGATNAVAREKVHNGATIAGIAFANAFLGVCHSMAHKLGAAFHVPHGLANALLICNVVRYNAVDNPVKQTAFSQYDRPQARRRYFEIAKHLGLAEPGDKAGTDVDRSIERLVTWLDGLKAHLGIPASIQAAGVAEIDFLAQVDRIAVEAFDDQCTGANPRFPLISELRTLLLDSYYGRAFSEPSERIVAVAPEVAAAPRKASRKSAGAAA